MSEQEIKELFSNEAYVSSLLALDTPEEVQVSLAEKGIDLSMSEITTLFESIQKYAQSDGELSEDDLEIVTGGILLSTICFAILAGILTTGFAGATMDAIRRRW